MHKAWETITGVLQSVCIIVPRFFFTLKSGIEPATSVGALCWYLWIPIGIALTLGNCGIRQSLFPPWSFFLASWAMDGLRVVSLFATCHCWGETESAAWHRNILYFLKHSLFTYFYLFEYELFWIFIIDIRQTWRMWARRASPLKVCLVFVLLNRKIRMHWMGDVVFLVALDRVRLLLAFSFSIMATSLHTFRQPPQLKQQHNNKVTMMQRLISFLMLLATASAFAPQAGMFFYR